MTATIVDRATARFVTLFNHEPPYAERAEADRHLDLLLRLSLVAVAINAEQDLAVLAVGVVALFIGFTRPQLARSPWFWLVLGLVLALRTVPGWIGVENHIFLINYWCLAVGLALWSGRPLIGLADTGRLLVGLVFALAVLWKLVVPDYVTSGFFEFILLADQRFFGFTHLIGAVSEAETTANLDQLALLAEGGTDAVTLVSSGRTAGWAWIMTWWTIVVETAIAVTFLAPPTSRLGRWRHLTLLGFALSLYTLVPILGFATTLLTMGLASTRPGERRVRNAYLVVMVVVVLAGPLWVLI